MGGPLTEGSRRSSSKAAWSDLVFARLVADHPVAHTYLVTSAHRESACETVAAEMAQSISTLGAPSTLVTLADRTELATTEAPESAVKRIALNARDLLGGEELRRMRSATGRITICAESLLDGPEPILLLPSVDAVILVVRRGSTTREELREVRDEVQRAHATLALAVLVG